MDFDSTNWRVSHVLDLNATMTAQNPVQAEAEGMAEDLGGAGQEV